MNNCPFETDLYMLERGALCSVSLLLEVVNTFCLAHSNFRDACSCFSQKQRRAFLSVCTLCERKKCDFNFIFVSRLAVASDWLACAQTGTSPWGACVAKTPPEFVCLFFLSLPQPQPSATSSFQRKTKLEVAAASNTVEWAATVFKMQLELLDIREKM